MSRLFRHARSLALQVIIVANENAVARSHEPHLSLTWIAAEIDAEVAATDLAGL